MWHHLATCAARNRPWVHRPAAFESAGTYSLARWRRFTHPLALRYSTRHHCPEQLPTIRIPRPSNGIALTMSVAASGPERILSASLEATPTTLYVGTGGVVGTAGKVETAGEAAASTGEAVRGRQNSVIDLTTA